MSSRRAFRLSRENPRLLTSRAGERTELWTETIGALPAVYGERWREFDGRTCRLFDPSRSKLAAALVHGWSGNVPQPGDRWLYLGAASGTTASHVADLVGPSGRVYAVEKSVRPFARLYALSERWPNLLPILADARAPEEYLDLVPRVDGLYADVAQPDQVGIARENAALFLRGEGRPILVALKASSMGRTRTPAAHLARGEEELGRVVDLAEAVKLDPFHRAHYLMGGQARPELFRGERFGSRLTSPAGRFRERRRP